MPHYDYATPGTYFVTICVEDRKCVLGEGADGSIVLSPAGRLVQEAWQKLPAHYPHIALDEFVVMPNHVHGLLIIENEGGTPLTEPIRAFKSFSAREINNARPEQAKFVWQRGFHEHVVRDKGDLTAIREYIQNNPMKWELDEENPARQRVTAPPQGGS